jgi:hypothetical protein
VAEASCIAPSVWTGGSSCSPNLCGVTAPDHDLCSNAFNLNSSLNNAPNTYMSPTYNTALATNDGPLPAALTSSVFGCTFGGTGGGAADGIDNSVWYVFTPCASGTLTIDAPLPDGTDYDSIMVVYAAATCNDATEASAVACADDEPMNIASLAVSAGLTYYIGIGDWGTFEGGGVTQVNFTFTPGAPCTPPGTCCRGSTCNTTIDAASCTAPSATIGATYAVGGLGNACNAAMNNVAPCCYADFNKLGGVSVQDIFDFLAAWFGSSPFARFGGDGTGVSGVQAIFDFLAAWFAGACPPYI